MAVETETAYASGVTAPETNVHDEARIRVALGVLFWYGLSPLDVCSAWQGRCQNEKRHQRERSSPSGEITPPLCSEVELSALKSLHRHHRSHCEGAFEQWILSSRTNQDHDFHECELQKFAAVQEGRIASALIHSATGADSPAL